MPDIPLEFHLSGTVSFWNVDRDNAISLKGVFSLFQEAAIRHADLCGTGALAMTSRGESWVLKGLSVSIDRYPAYEEPITVVTWSTGVTGFKGYRDFRMLSNGVEFARGSSLWLYFSLASKSLLRVPKDVADQFPRKEEPPFDPELDRLKLRPPAAGGTVQSIGLRYTDFDANQHVNNTAYFDLLQSALASSGGPLRPRRLRVLFSKGIPVGEHQALVSFEPGEAHTVFSIGDTSGPAAVGTVA